MKKIFTILVFLVIAFFSSVMAQTKTTIYFEGWESGFGNWGTVDNSGLNEKRWHLDSFEAYGGTGESWWMANSSLGVSGGYSDYWYQTLDTEPIVLAGTNPKVEFYQRYSVETLPPGIDPEGYDGYDGMNVRISTNTGESWEVLENSTPAYNSTSMYGFGFVHKEGLGIPGWGGELLDWTKTEIDLSAFTGQTVMIRFAFASDPSYSTISGGPALSMFGWQVDEILVSSSDGILFSNIGTENGLTPKNVAKFGGDLWTLAEEINNKFISCNNTENSYNPLMNNILFSEWIDLPASYSKILLNFKVKASFEDVVLFQGREYFGVGIQVEGEVNPRYLSNINGAGIDSSYYSVPNEWTLFSDVIEIDSIDISALAGKRVSLVFSFQSDGDDPIGEGIQIDDITIYTPQMTSVNQGNELKYEFSLEQNYPNPFNPTTSISFSIPETSVVQLKVYDVLGSELTTLINDQMAKGNHAVEFNASNLSSGIYLYQLILGNLSQTRKMIFLK